MSKMSEISAYLGLTKEEAAKTSNKELIALLDEFEEYLTKAERLEQEIDRPSISRIPSLKES